jgi:hypothetical protein
LVAASVAASVPDAQYSSDVLQEDLSPLNPLMSWGSLNTPPKHKGKNHMNTLQNKRVAILATEGFEYVELVEPRKALGQAGAKTEVVSPKDGKIKGWATNKMGWRRRCWRAAEFR